MTDPLKNKLADGWSRLRSGDLRAAEARAREVLRQAPRQPGAWHLLGLVALNAGLHDQAAVALERGLRQAPREPDLHNHLAEALRRSGRAEEALKAAKRAAALAPAAAAVWNNLGLAARDSGDLELAENALIRAVRLDGRYAKAAFNLGSLLLDAERLEEAEDAMRRATERDPGYAKAWDGLGACLASCRRFDEARAALEHALSLAPKAAKSWFHLGQVHAGEQEHEKAIGAFERALALDHDYSAALAAKARLLADLSQHEQAEADLRRALELSPDDAELWDALGGVAFARFDFAAAGKAFARALDLDPDRPEARASLILCRAEICDWRRRSEEVAALKDLVNERLAAGAPSPLTPHAAVFFPLEPSMHRAIAVRRAEVLAEEVGDRRLPAPPKPPTQRPGRLKIGYLSSDFRNNAQAHLMRGLYGLHDRQRFEIHGFSLGVDDGSDYRRRIAADCDYFTDLREATDREVAERIRADGIHILMELTGYAGGGRPRVLAYRPAPLQASWHYCGSMGGLFYDYFFGDPVITPDGHSPQIVESTVVLPHCYLITDHEQEIADPAPERSELGLPEHAFVFACFCAPAKIDPEIFDLWMRLLHAVPDSVLWLLDIGAEARGNLQREASERGIEPDRLVFARHLPKAEHLARLRRADLGLDTVICNGHTTVGDALWAGLPVITTPGQSLAGNVAVSMLKAIGLPELVAPDHEAYEALALRLAREKTVLTDLRTKLADQRTTYPLFDTPRFVRNLERAYDDIWARHQRGEAPSTILVEDPGQ